MIIMLMLVLMLIEELTGLLHLHMRKYTGRGERPKGRTRVRSLVHILYQGPSLAGWAGSR